MNDNDKRREWDAWHEKFCQSKKGGAAIKSLNILKKYGTETKYIGLEYVLISECYKASLYNEKIDKDRLQAKRNHPKNADELINLLSKVKSMSRKHNNESHYSLQRVLNKLELEDNIIIQPEKLNGIYFLKKFIDYYIEEIKAHKTPFHSRDVGPLIFPKSVHNNTSLPDIRLTGLALHLIARFRNWTDRGEAGCITVGQFPRKYGKPCYKQVSEFINAALDLEGDAIQDADSIKDRITKFLKNNPEIRIGGWPYKLPSPF